MATTTTLQPRPSRAIHPSFRRLILLTAALGLGAGLAFGVGVLYGGRDASSAASAGTAGATATTSGAAAQGSATGGGAGPTTGVEEEVSGDLVTIRTSAGGTVAVKLAADTQIRQTAAATAAAITPGATLTVTGLPDLDGNVAARTVQIGAGPARSGSGEATASRTPATGATGRAPATPVTGQ